MARHYRVPRHRWVGYEVIGELPSSTQPAPDSRGELGPFGAFWLGVALGAVLAGFAVGLWVAR